MLQARNCYQILGEDLKTPSLFVVCWHTGSGGTTQAVRLARKHNIPVFNLYVDKDKTDLKKFLKLNASLPGW